MAGDMIRCPFNKYHLIHTLKFPSHILKCKKQYPNIELHTCAYNATHMYTSKTDLEAHLKECESKCLLEPWRFNISDGQHGDFTQTPFNALKTDSDNEGWD